MIEKQFWMDAKAAWIISAPPKITNVHTGSGGTIDPSLLCDPWDTDVEFDDIDFDNIDFDKSVQSMINGGDCVLKNGQGDKPLKEQPIAPSRPRLDIEKFEQEMERRTLQGYTEAAKLLWGCELPEEMSGLYQELIARMPVLEEARIKFESVYQADLEQFYDYYIPESLQLTSTYLEYLDAGIGDDIVRETEAEIMDAVTKLITAVNDKIDEIYKFASIEIKAKAKALESLMSQDGYVDPEFKLK